jgi:PAS domain S-box-containing protein
MDETPTREELVRRIRELEAKALKTSELEEALAQSEDKYSRMLANLKDEFLFYRHDTEGRFTYISPSYANILGFSPEEYLNQYCGKLWTPNPINKEADRHTRLSCAGQRQPAYELEIYHKNGSYRRFVNIEIPIFDADGRVIAVEGTARDITEKRKIEEKLENYRKNLEKLVDQRTQELRNSQRQLLDIIDFLPYPTYVVDKRHKIVAWNRAMTGLSELSKDEVLGKNFAAFVAPLYGPGATLLVEAVLSGRNPTSTTGVVDDAYGVGLGLGHQRAHFEERFVPHLHDRNGGYLWVTAAPILDNGNIIAGAIEMIRDVTQLKQAERAIAESERQLSTLMNNLPGMAYRMVKAERGWEVEFVSDGCRLIFSQDPDFFIGRRIAELKRLIHPDDLAQLTGEVSTAIRELGSVNCQYRILSADDSTKWVFDKAEVLLRPSDGNLCIEGFMTDFTLYKIMEEKLKNENFVLRSTMRDRYRFQGLIGRCQAMQEVFELILKASSTDDHVFVSGESGTGKELVAKAIHQLSTRKDKPFLAVNCAAIPENLIESEFFGVAKGAFTGANSDKKGYLESAEGGTLFLDEVGDISPTLQVKLLRAIDGGGFSPLGGRRLVYPNIRIIAASNKDLEKLIEGGLMRQDFFFRIHVIPIHLPPLRERGDDIFMLVNYFLKQFSETEGITSFSREELEILRDHPWPGNVRELQNVLRRYLAMKSLNFMKVTKKLTPKVGSPSAISSVNVRPVDSENLRNASGQFEKKLIQDVLTETRWNKSLAAEMLGISRRTLFRKMKAAGLS